MLVVIDHNQECKFSLNTKEEAFQYVKNKLFTFPERMYYIIDDGSVYLIYSYYKKIYCTIIGGDPGRRNIRINITHKDIEDNL